MNAGPASMPPSGWDHWYRRALPAYWLFLFCSTHFPALRLPRAPLPSDKVVHLVAFGLLAFLFWRFAETFRRPISARFAWLGALGLVLYAAVDEYLQQFVNRSTNAADWLCDVAGIVIVLALLEWHRRACWPFTRKKRTC